MSNFKRVSLLELFIWHLIFSNYFSYFFFVEKVDYRADYVLRINYVEEIINRLLIFFKLYSRNYQFSVSRAIKFTKDNPLPRS